METLSKSKTAEREISITRILNAPKELVFEAFTDPKHISQWWGPNGFTTTIHEMDLRAGGKWLHTMHGPDGKDYPNEATFTEIVKPDLIKFTHALPKFEVTVTFEAVGNKTRLTMSNVFETAEIRNIVAKEYGAVEGQVQTINRFEELLSKMSATKELTITRTFNAPIDLVWAAWTDVEHIKNWWGPKGFTNPVCNWNTEIGCKIFIEMKAPDGIIYPMDGEFKEIMLHEKIVFTSAAIDKSGKHLFEVLNTVTFNEEGDKTKLVLHFIFSNIKPEGLQHIGGAEIGWNMSLDKLVLLLDKLK
jgi:uncharacterized protein YndB with AHSA1/START domain